MWYLPYLTYIFRSAQKYRKKLKLKNILHTKSNHVNTIHRLFNVETEIVNRLNYFNYNSEILGQNGKAAKSLHDLKTDNQYDNKRQETDESMGLPYISLRKKSKIFFRRAFSYWDYKKRRCARLRERKWSLSAQKIGKFSK